MPNFDSVLAELSAKLDAAMKVIAEHPELAAKVAAAIDTAPVAAVTSDEVLQDQARANALAVALREARASLPVPEPPAPTLKKSSGNRRADAPVGVPVAAPAVGVTGATGSTGATGA